MDESTPAADTRECYEIVEDPKTAQSPGSKPLVRAPSQPNWWHASISRGCKPPSLPGYDRSQYPGCMMHMLSIRSQPIPRTDCLTLCT